MKLNERAVRGLQLPDGKTDHLYWDDDIPGLGVRLRAGGSRSWVFQYSIGKKHRRMSLGSVSRESFRIIREQAAKLHAQVKLGQDPAGQKEEGQKRATDTFETIAKNYLAAKRESTRPRTYREIERYILKHASSLNGMHVAGITRRDIATLTTSIKQNAGAVTANRARSTLSDFFAWCMSEGLEIETNPVIGTNKFEEKSRDRVLNDAELREIWNNLGDDQYGSIVKLLMLTGQRADEIASLRWSEIHDGAIHLPGDRTKNGRPHIIPLSDAAKAILDAQHRRTNDDGGLRDLIFGVGQRGFWGWSYCKGKLDERIELEHWTVHDIRRTVATLMNDRLGILPHVVEAVLNHVSGSKGGVAGIYNRAQYLKERTAALNLWADHLAAIVEGKNNVTPLRRA